MAIVDLNQLAAPDVVEVLDYETILAERKATLVSLSIDLGLDDDALSCEWTLGGLPDVELWAQYASPGADSVPLRFTGSYQRDDTGAISAVEVVMRGRHKEYDGGENKQGESGTTKISTECAYYQLTIDGKEVIEIDVINMVLKVDGVDRLAEHRKAIGL